MIKEKGLPPELEAVVKDLWTIRLPLIEERFSAKYPIVEEESGADETEGGSSGAETKLFSSQDVEDTEVETEGEGKKADQDAPRTERIWPSVTESLALCYMGLMLLRLPVSVGDLHR